VHKTFRGEKNRKPFTHLSFGKAGPFTLESHIHVKALNMQGFSQSLDALLNPY
jgi:hypothetical protein